MNKGYENDTNKQSILEYYNQFKKGDYKDDDI